MFKNVNLEYVSINGPLAQSVERGANNVNITSAKLIRNSFHFLCGLISVFNEFACIHCSKITNREYVCIDSPLA